MSAYNAPSDSPLISCCQNRSTSPSLSPTLRRGARLAPTRGANRAFELPQLRVFSVAHLPPVTLYTVMTLETASPYLSNEILPVAPSKLTEPTAVTVSARADLASAALASDVLRALMMALAASYDCAP